MELFKEAVWLPVAYLFDPARRVFIGYLLMSGLIGLCLFYFVHGKSFAESWRELFAKRNWWSGSARTDYGLFFIGLCFKAVCIVPYLSVGSMLAYALSMQLTEWLGPRPDASSSLWVAFCYPVILFLVKDFFVFVTHYYLHRNRYLWEFHKVHHSATVMNPFTLYRMHPVEILLQNLQGMAALPIYGGFCTSNRIFLLFQQSSGGPGHYLGRQLVQFSVLHGWCQSSPFFRAVEISAVAGSGVDEPLSAPDSSQ